MKEGEIVQIVEMKIESLVPYENNPRNNDNSVDAVAASIREFGFKVPIVVDKDNVIVAGHTRLKAAKKLGLKAVPAIIADDLTEEQIKAFRLADNKTAELAAWDFSALDEELANIDMDMSDFGFNFDFDEDYTTDFSLVEGERKSLLTMTFTLSDDEADVVKQAIADMKRSEAFQQYENPKNENSSGRALFLVVSEWQAQKILL